MAKSPRYYGFSSIPRVSQQGHCHLTGELCAPSSNAHPTRSTAAAACSLGWMQNPPAPASHQPGAGLVWEQLRAIGPRPCLRGAHRDKQCLWGLRESVFSFCPAGCKNCRLLNLKVWWCGGDVEIPGCHSWHTAWSLEISGCPLVCRSTELLHFTRWNNSCLQFLSRVLNAPCLNYFGYCGRAAPCTHHKAHPNALSQDCSSRQTRLLPSQWAAAQINRTREKCALQTEKVSIWALSVTEGWTWCSWKYFAT